MWVGADLAAPTRPCRDRGVSLMRLLPPPLGDRQRPIAAEGVDRAVGGPSTAPGARPRPPEAPGRRGYLPQLDAVRGIACLMVLGAHLKAVRGLHWVDDRIGTAGVGLFFAMSGFLITRILIADKRSGHGLNAFYNRRAAR